MQKLLHCRPNGAEDHGGVNEVYLPDGFGEVVGPQRKDLLQHLSSCVWTCVIVSDVYTECIHRVYTHAHTHATHTHMQQYVWDGTFFLSPIIMFIVTPVCRHGYLHVCAYVRVIYIHAYIDTPLRPDPMITWNVIISYRSMCVCVLLRLDHMIDKCIVIWTNAMTAFHEYTVTS